MEKKILLIVLFILALVFSVTVILILEHNQEPTKEDILEECKTKAWFDCTGEYPQEPNPNDYNLTKWCYRNESAVNEKYLECNNVIDVDEMWCLNFEMFKCYGEYYDTE